MRNSELYYSVGALLYCPTTNEGIVQSLKSEKFGSSFSLALCLEDTINDNCVLDAEIKLIHSIKELHNYSKTSQFFIPKIFIRVRNSQQINYLLEQMGEAKSLITGFIIPKFSLENADEYIDVISSLNKVNQQTFYMMPIIETPSVINLQNRYDILYTLKDKLQKIEPYVLNIRVGGNDLCHVFGFRRQSNESIHNFRPVSNIISDIITVFGADYVVSGPVWEYYNGDNWDEGLIQELKEDRLCGIVGKTVIHPKQISLVNDAYKVSLKDYEDAMSILNWDTASESFVSGNSSMERMNEYKTHLNWAEKIMMLSKVYGILKQ